MNVMGQALLDFYRQRDLPASQTKVEAALLPKTRQANNGFATTRSLHIVGRSDAETTTAPTGWRIRRRSMLSGVYETQDLTQSLNAFFTSWHLMFLHNSVMQATIAMGFKLKGCVYGANLSSVTSNIWAAVIEWRLKKLVTGDSKSTIVEWYETAPKD